MKRLFIFSVLIALFSFESQANDERREKFKAVFEACIQENNIQRPEPGERPSDEMRGKMEACLASKGIEKPKRGPRP